MTPDTRIGVNTPNSRTHAGQRGWGGGKNAGNSVMSA